MNLPTSGEASFVVFPLGGRHFALPTTEVLELSRNGEVQTFPHTTPALEGVLVCRGEILPVWNLAQTLLGSNHLARKYWLVTRRNFAGEERTAIPVTGECRMLQAEMVAPPEGSPAHVQGVVFREDQPVEVLDLARLATGWEVAGDQEREEPREGK